MTKYKDFANNSSDPIYLEGHLATYLRRDGVNTVEDLLKLSEGQILRIPGVGRKGLLEIRDALGINAAFTLGEMRALSRSKSE